MEQVKEAFSKVKQDMDSLKKEVSSLSEDLIDTRKRLIEICDVLKVIARKNEKIQDNSKKDESTIPTSFKEIPFIPLHYSCPFYNQSSSCFPSSFNVPHETQMIPTQNSKNPAEREENKTNPAHNLPYNSLKDENKVLSTGNEGVPTDRQTNQQTNQQTDKGSYNIGIKSEEDSSSDYINDAAKILDSLDTIKKEVRLKFKRLTDQEFSVFSVIYQLSEEEGYTDYKNLSIKLGLTESSIRDYIGRLIKKGIPVEKTKINNKTIHLSVSSNLKKIASLPTILQLRAL